MYIYVLQGTYVNVSGPTCLHPPASVKLLLHLHSEEDRSVSDQSRPRATQFYL